MTDRGPKPSGPGWSHGDGQLSGFFLTVMTRTVPAALAAGGSQMAYNIMYNIMYNIKQFKTIRNNLFLYCQILFYIVCNIVYNMKQYALQYEKTCTIN